MDTKKFLYNKVPKCCISVQSLSCVQLFVTPWTAACQASLSIINSQNLLKLISIMLVMPSNHPILCHPLLLPLSIFPSIRVFSNESVLCIRSPKYWSFSFQHQSFWWTPRTLGWTGWISLLSKRRSRVFSNTTQFKSIHSLALSFLSGPTLHTWLLEKP